VKALMLGEIDKLRKGEFSDDLIQSIVNNYKKSKIEQDESYNQRASNLMDDFTSGVDWRTDVASISELSKVTKPQINRLCQQIFKRQQLCNCLQTPGRR
jgi:predicted Zn-dependent peptidase